MSRSITLLTAAATSGLARIAGIYEAAIPASERKPTAELLALPGRGDYRVDAVKVGEDVAGFAVWFWPPDEAFALLEYLAIDVGYRGQGLGAALVRHTLGGGRTIVAEVEADDDAHPERARRTAFYRRLGFRRVVGLDYLLPLRTAGLPPPMQLLLYRPDAPTPLPRERLARWLGVIYERVYGQAADDPRVAAMVGTVGDPVEVE